MKLVNYGKSDTKDRNYRIDYFHTKSTLKYLECHIQSIFLRLSITAMINFHQIALSFQN